MLDAVELELLLPVPRAPAAGEPQLHPGMRIEGEPAAARPHVRRGLAPSRHAGERISRVEDGAHRHIQG